MTKISPRRPLKPSSKKTLLALKQKFTMFKFLFGRQRELNYLVFYKLKGSDFVVCTTIKGVDEFDANRIFDQTYPVEYQRLPSTTRLAR